MKKTLTKWMNLTQILEMFSNIMHYLVRKRLFSFTCQRPIVTLNNDSQGTFQESTRKGSLIHKFNHMKKIKVKYKYFRVWPPLMYSIQQIKIYNLNRMNTNQTVYLLQQERKKNLALRKKVFIFIKVQAPLLEVVVYSKRVFYSQIYTV